MAVVLQTAHTEEAHLPRLQHSVWSRGARPSRGIEQERDHGAPDHSLSAPSTMDCTAGPRGGSRPKSSPPLLITLRRPLPLRYHLSRSFGDDAQRIATRSATDHDPPRSPFGTQALRSRLDRYQIEPISPLGTAQAEALTGHATNTRAGGCPNRLDVAQPIPDRYRANCRTRHPEPSMQPP